MYQKLIKARGLHFFLPDVSLLKECGCEGKKNSLCLKKVSKIAQKGCNAGTRMGCVQQGP